MKSIFLTMLLIVFQTIYGQNTFHKLYGGELSDEGNSVCITNEGDYVVTGTINSHDISPSNYGGNVFILRANESGDILWTREIQMGIKAVGRCVRQTYDGGFIITGYLKSGYNNFSIFLIKLDGNGEVLWSKILFEEEQAWSECIEQTSDTGFILAGKHYIDNDVYGDAQMILIKTDNNGNVSWIKEFGGNGEEGSDCLVQTMDDGYAIFGYTRSFGNDYDFFLVKTNNEGDSLWSNWYGTWDFEFGHELHQTLDSGFIMVGTSYYMTTRANIYAVRTDKHGDALWTRMFDEFPGSMGSSVQQISDSGYIIGGWSKVGSQHWSLLLLKLDISGDIMWYRSFENDESRGNSVRQTEDGGYIITGSQEITNPNWDVVLIKTDADGLIYIREENIPQRISIEAYPNPFSTSTTFAYILQRPVDVKLTVHNVQGQLLFEMQERQGEGEQKVEWREEEIPSGIYFYRIQAGDRSGAGKIIKTDTK